jgi:hypothetical protein
MVHTRALAYRRLATRMRARAWRMMTASRMRAPSRISSAQGTCGGRIRYPQRLPLTLGLQMHAGRGRHR